MIKVFIRDNSNNENYYYLLSNEQIALLKKLEENNILQAEIEIEYFIDEKFEDIK